MGTWREVWWWYTCGGVSWVGGKWEKWEGTYFCDAPVLDYNGGRIHAKVDENGGRGRDSGEEGNEKGAEEFTAEINLAELGV